MRLRRKNCKERNLSKKKKKKRRKDSVGNVKEKETITVDYVIVELGHWL